MYCQICNRDFSNYKALSSHIRQSHKISSEDYYIQYINSKHNCIICNKPTKFISLKDGFHDYCCIKCSNKDPPAKIEKQVITFKSNPKNIEQAKQHIIARNKSDKARKKSSELGKKNGSLVLTKLHKENDKIYWSHNDHFFDETNKDDLAILEKWIEKANAGHKQYQNAVNVWTVRDISRRNAAIQNNLNYVVLWSLEDIDKYIQELVSMVK